MLSIEKLVETILNGNISDGKKYFQEYNTGMRHAFFEYVNSEMLTDEKKCNIYWALRIRPPQKLRELYQKLYRK